MYSRDNIQKIDEIIKILTGYYPQWDKNSTKVTIPSKYGGYSTMKPSRIIEGFVVELHLEEAD